MSRRRGTGRGRSRPWRVTSDSQSFETGTGDPETDIAGEALERTVVERTYDLMREWWSRRLTYPAKWRRAAFMTDTVRYLTPAELKAVLDEVQAIFDRYQDRDDKGDRPAEACRSISTPTGTPSLPRRRATSDDARGL